MRLLSKAWNNTLTSLGDVLGLDSHRAVGPHLCRMEGVIVACVWVSLLLYVLWFGGTRESLCRCSVYLVVCLYAQAPYFSRNFRVRRPTSGPAQQSPGDRAWSHDVLFWPETQVERTELEVKQVGHFRGVKSVCRE